MKAISLLLLSFVAPLAGCNTDKAADASDVATWACPTTGDDCQNGTLNKIANKMKALYNSGADNGGHPYAAKAVFIKHSVSMPCKRLTDHIMHTPGAQLLLVDGDDSTAGVGSDQDAAAPSQETSGDDASTFGFQHYKTWDDTSETRQATYWDVYDLQLVAVDIGISTVHVKLQGNLAWGDNDKDYSQQKGATPGVTLDMTFGKGGFVASGVEGLGSLVGEPGYNKPWPMQYAMSLNDLYDQSSLRCGNNDNRDVATVSSAFARSTNPGAPAALDRIADLLRKDFAQAVKAPDGGGYH